MRRSKVIHIGAVIAAAGLFLASTGCTKLLYLSTGTSFVSGLLLGNNLTLTSVEQTCYQNGVLINCADLPEDLGQ